MKRALRDDCSLELQAPVADATGFSKRRRFDQNAQTFTIRQRKPLGVGTRRFCRQLGGTTGATMIGAGAKKMGR
jgi:hypothetical protein